MSVTPPMGEPREARQHVLVLNQYALPLEQGGGTRHIELFSRLNPEQWSFTILASNRANQSGEVYSSKDPHFELIPTPGHGDQNGRKRILGWLIFALRSFRSGMRGARPDIVYASTPHLLTPVAGLLIARLRRSRFVLEIRDLWPDSLVEFGYLEKSTLLHAMLEWLERLLYQASDHVVIVTAGWHDHLLSKGVHARDITTVSNGSDPDVFAPANHTRSIREILEVDGPVVVYAGAHGPPNGLDAVLDAAKELPEVTFALFGDGVSKATLVRRASDEGLVNVIFRDPVPKSELASFLWTADIGLHTLADLDLFRKGMSPNKLYDYLAAKLPLVSNAGGAARHLIESTQCGAASTPNGLAEAIRRVLAVSTDQRRQMGERGYDWLLANASRQAVVRDLERCLQATVRRQ